MTIWLWFFGNTLGHTRKQSHHRLSQHRLRNTNLIRSCSPLIHPTVPFGQLESCIPPPKFWSWNIYLVNVTTSHNIINYLAHQWESKWAAWLLLDHQCLAIIKWKFRTTFFAIIVVWYYLLPNPTPRPRHVWPPVHQSIYSPHFPSYIDYEIYKDKITPVVIGCKDKRNGNHLKENKRENKHTNKINK